MATTNTDPFHGPDAAGDDDLVEEDETTSYPLPFHGPDGPPGPPRPHPVPEVEEYLRTVEVARSIVRDMWSNSMATRGRPERQRRDPFRPFGGLLDLEERLWTTDRRELPWWTGHPNPTARRILALHETCPPDLLDRLADDPWVEVRQAALRNAALDEATRDRMACEEPVGWLREAAGLPGNDVAGRCCQCGSWVKRPDRFLTCSIRCSVAQNRERIEEGAYLKVREDYRGMPDEGWPDTFMWEVAVREKKGSVPGVGPAFAWVYLSFVPGLAPRELREAVRALAEREDLTGEEAVAVVDRLAQDMDSADLHDACMATAG